MTAQCLPQEYIIINKNERIQGINFSFTKYTRSLKII